jgi:hypothetical protein
LTLLDNITHLLGDDLKRTLTPGAKLRIAASCFSIYAYEALKAELEQVDSVEFIFTSPTFVPNEVSDKFRKEHRESHIPKMERERSLYGSDFEVRLRNELTQKAIAPECADWMRRKSADTPRLPLPVALDLSALHDQLIRQHLPLPARPDETLREHVARVQEIHAKQREASQLKGRLQREKQFNRKVELNQRLRALLGDLSNLGLRQPAAAFPEPACWPGCQRTAGEKPKGLSSTPQSLTAAGYGEKSGSRLPQSKS